MVIDTSSPAPFFPLRHTGQEAALEHQGGVVQLQREALQRLGWMKRREAQASRP